MAKKYEVAKHRGLSLKFRRLIAFKNGVKYVGYEIRDYSSGRLVRHHRSTLAEAARRYFSIVPLAEAANLIPMPQPEAAAEPDLVVPGVGVTVRQSENH